MPSDRPIPADEVDSPDVTSTRPPFIDRDLTDTTPERRAHLINGWLERHRSVELFYRAAQNERRLIARLWRISL